MSLLKRAKLNRIMLKKYNIKKKITLLKIQNALVITIFNYIINVIQFN